MSMRSHTSNLNNSFGYASAASRPQPPPRRRANSMGSQNLNATTNNHNTSSVISSAREPRRSLFNTTLVSIYTICMEFLMHWDIS